MEKWNFVDYTAGKTGFWFCELAVEVLWRKKQVKKF